MSDPVGAERFRQQVAVWAQETTDPNAGLGNNLANGSMWLRNGSYPTTPTEMYLNLIGGAKGWVKQNQVNLNVYNVKLAPYNAVGDGVADDTVAINAAISAAVAANNGTIYFPPGTYKVTKPALATDSILLDNVHDLLFLGDGYASRIAMIGSASAGAWNMFRLKNGTTRIRFHNLRLTGDGITNSNVADHCIMIQGVSGDPNGGVTDVEVSGCYFGQFPGDGVRILGEVGEECSNIRVLYNTFDMAVTTGSHANIEAQRYSRRVIFAYNWCSGSNAQLIDFEPTLGAGVGTAGPEEWQIYGNHLDGSGVGGGVMIALTGINSTDPSQRNLCSYNTLSNGDGITSFDLQNILLLGNIIISAGTSTKPCIEFLRFMAQLSCIGNIAVATNGTGAKNCINFTENNSQDAFQCVVAENVMRTVAAVGLSTDAVVWNGGARNAVNGNIAVVDIVTVNTSFGIAMSSTSVNELDSGQVNGNLIKAPTGILRSGINFAASGGKSIRNVQSNCNFINNAASAVFYSRAGAETFLDWRCANDNNLIGGTNLTIEVPATNVGATVEGTAGPGAQQIQVGTTPAGLVAAPVGSLVANSGGGATTAISYKETAVGLSGGTAGWVGIGGSELAFSVQNPLLVTTAVFMATGMGLVNATAPEIQVACPRAGNIRNMRVKQVPGTGVGSMSYNYRKNGVDTISLGVLFTASVGTIGTSTTVAVGDLLSLKITKTQAPTTAPTFCVVTMELN
jgi:hypothetical protein